MNSLNLISSRVIGQAPSQSRPRSRSQGEILSSKQSDESLRGRSWSDENLTKAEKNLALVTSEAVKSESLSDEASESLEDDVDEKAPLLDDNKNSEVSRYQSRLRRLVKRIADALTTLLTTIGAPIVFTIRCLQDDDGTYSPVIPIKRISRAFRTSKASKSTSTAVGLANAPEGEAWDSEKPIKHNSQELQLNRSYSSDSLRSTTSESEPDQRLKKQGTSRKDSSKSRNAEKEPARRQSIRIKLNNEESLKKRKSKRSALAEALSPPLTVDNIKSPTSPSTSFKPTRYPQAPRPPRPLIPRRQPSYSEFSLRSHSMRPSPASQQQKTLVLDLDETLIHSMAKGGRMSSGHMVEVKLNTPVALAPAQSGQAPPILGPQHPILYWVNERPHCYDFLRKVQKWYKLVVFTASVQEYADPVIDLLEKERKYFSGRLYRQHCTFRNGAYIKDLSSVEPDLSKVMILDNSPVSYIFHEDNAIPIEGWINDPTDNDLLHLIPILEALQYVTDVRALLALRRGEAEAS